MPTEPQPVTLLDVARRAVDISDPAKPRGARRRYKQVPPARRTAECKGDPPERVLDWLADRGLQV